MTKEESKRNTNFICCTRKHSTGRPRRYTMQSSITDVCLSHAACTEQKSSQGNTCTCTMLDLLVCSERGSLTPAENVCVDLQRLKLSPVMKISASRDQQSSDFVRESRSYQKLFKKILIYAFSVTRNKMGHILLRLQVEYLNCTYSVKSTYVHMNAQTASQLYAKLHKEHFLQNNNRYITFMTAVSFSMVSKRVVSSRTAT